MYAQCNASGICTAFINYLKNFMTYRNVGTKHTFIFLYVSLKHSSR